MFSKLPLSVPDVWRRLNLPGEPKTLCVCPFHLDCHASFSIYQNGQRWKCFAGCGSGDAVNFLAKATGLTNREAFGKVLEEARGSGVKASIPFVSKPQLVRARPSFPSDLHQGNSTEFRQIASLRGLSLEGVEFASLRGLLLFGRVCGSRCWIVTDATRTLAQARRMDGLPFPAFGPLASRKAHTLKGSRQGWPLGICEAARISDVLIVEGGPDLLAACHFIALAGRNHHLVPVAMLGASNRIPTDALPLFAGKRVRLYPHADANGAGRNAAARWTWQLEKEGLAAEVDAFRFDGLFLPDGSPVNDLNDAARMHSSELLEGMLP